MKHSFVRLSFALLSLGIALFAGAHRAHAADPYQSHPTGNDLFGNYYTYGGGVPAQLYLSPRPVPAYTGHTYITYQPLNPHEFLYGHKRTYWSHPAGAGWTQTKVHYHTRGYTHLLPSRIRYPRPMPGLYDPGWSH